MLEGGSIKSRLQKIFRGTKKAWDSFITISIKIKTEKMVYNHIVYFVQDNIILKMERKQENII